MIVLENVLDPDEVAAVLEALNLADFDDGRLSAGDSSAPALRVKTNLQLKRTSAEPIPLDQLVISSLSKHELMRAFAFPKNFATTIFSKYHPGMKYGAHVDAAGHQLFRSDLSVTLFLSDPSTYDGGELVIETDAGSKAFKLPAGNAIVYPTFFVHQVAEITRGERVAAVTWCQSLIRDPQMRRVLFDLTAVVTSLNEDDPDSARTALANKGLSNLKRLLIEP